MLPEAGPPLRGQPDVRVAGGGGPGGGADRAHPPRHTGQCLPGPQPSGQVQARTILISDSFSHRKKDKTRFSKVVLFHLYTSFWTLTSGD